ncbi:MAG TPA: hypothetical protein VFT81_06180 [Dermatophilaceae bacterium]|nr:hypothetical protein [Dermatophilaceae bacterium]
MAVAAVVFALAVTGCSKAENPPASATGTTSSTPASSTGTSTATTSEATTTGATGSTGSTGSTPSKVAVDQSTPEAAMTSWLNAMFAGDKEAVCSLMASGGKAIADVPQAVETCSSMIGGMLDQLQPLAGAFKGLTIEGATVSGDTASFESATTEPAMAAQIISSFKAVRIDGDWYITQG